jgi:hypothetical protein
MKTELVNFTKEEVEKVWPLVESLVQKACKTNGGYNAEHILGLSQERHHATMGGY